MTTHHWTAADTSRGKVVLVHGLSASSDTWWQVGPALAARGYDVTAVDQAGHGDHALDGPVHSHILVDAVLAAVPERPQVLVGHSLGAITALALLAREPCWADVVVLEDPPCRGDLAPEEFTGLVAAGVRADTAAVRVDRSAVVARIREECPRWTEEDVEYSVRGIERMDGEAFATWLERTAPEEDAFDTVARVLEVHPTPHVLAARSPKSFFEGGSAVSDQDRQVLQEKLPHGHLVEIDGGHSLHRDAPDVWLDAVERAAGSSQR